MRRVTKILERTIEWFIFASRWLQAPVYVGLIVGSMLYVYKFMEELFALIRSVTTISETHVMLGVLGLIDISMVMNLMVIVVIGGYSIFTSRIDFDQSEDKPQWLDYLDADTLKTKLSTSLASISGVHLLKTFIDLHMSESTSQRSDLQYEIAIHLVFIASALALSWIARLLRVPER